MKKSKEEIAAINAANKARQALYEKVPCTFIAHAKWFAMEQVDKAEFILDILLKVGKITDEDVEYFNGLRDTIENAHHVTPVEDVARQAFTYALERLKTSFFITDNGTKTYDEAMSFYKGWYNARTDNLDVDDYVGNLIKFINDWEDLNNNISVDEKGDIVVTDTHKIKDILHITDDEDIETAIKDKAAEIYRVQLNEIRTYKINFKKILSDKEMDRDIKADNELIREDVFKKYVYNEFLETARANTFSQLESLSELIEYCTGKSATEDKTFNSLSKAIENCKKTRHYEKDEKKITVYAWKTARSYLGDTAWQAAWEFWMTFATESKKYVPNSFDNISDFKAAIEMWTWLNDMFEIDDHGDIITRYEMRINKLARRMEEIFFPNQGKRVHCLPREKQIKFIDECIGNFVVRTQSLKITKENIELIKMPHKDLKGAFDKIKDDRHLVDPTTGVSHTYDTYVKISKVSFDSRQAHKLTADDVRFNKDATENKIRIVATSEDGISRMLRDKGLSFITVNIQDLADWELADMFNLPKEEMEQLNDWIKYKIFKYGIIDEATNKLYMPVFQSPSSKRQANFMFVEVSKKHPWEDVKQLWMDASGYNDRKYTADNNFKHLLEALGSENEKGEMIVNFSKFIARITSRGSNSIDISRVNPKFDEIIRKANCVYTNDEEIEINRPWKSFQYDPETNKSKMDFMVETDKETGKLVPKKRTLTLGDGQMIGSFTFMAQMAAAVHEISEDEYNKFLRLWDSANRDYKNVKKKSDLDRLIMKIPSVFQIRHGSKKGIIVRCNLEAINKTVEYTYERKLNNGEIEKTTQKIDLSTVDIICPDSVRKYYDGEWSEHPLEICAWLKKKGKYVAMNPQFWQCLEFEKNDQINEIAEYWLNYMSRSIDDPAYMMDYFNIKGSDEDDDINSMWKKETNNKDSNIQAAIKANTKLIHEVKIRQWIFAKYEKQINDMKVGRVLVPGMYTYMVCDPARIVAKTFGIDLPHLQSGEYYHNGMECNVAAFRSPLIWAGEAQKIKCQNHKYYRHLKNLMVFNGYDGIWDLMGGGDFDGDTNAVVPETGTFKFGDKVYPVGKWIVNAIRHFDYDVCEKGMNATKEVFNEENYVNYLVKAAKTDRVGQITNYATKAQDIANHLRGLVQKAKEMNLKYIFFNNPRFYPEKVDKVQAKPEIGVHGMNVLPYKGYVSKETSKKYNQTEYGNMLVTRGFRLFAVDPAEGYKTSFINKNGDVMESKKKRTFIENKMRDILGAYTIEDVEEMIVIYENDVMKLKLLQGREIDGAKTGVYAEGSTKNYPRRNDFTDEVKCEYNSRHLVDRLVHLGRLDVFTKGGQNAWEYHLNEYRSLSPLGQLNEYVTKHAEDMIYKKLGVAKEYKWQTWSEKSKKFVNKKDENGNPIVVPDVDIHGNLQYKPVGTELHWILTNHLTEDEKKQIYNTPIKYTDKTGSTKTYDTLIKAMEEFDTDYSTKHRDLKIKPKEFDLQEAENILDGAAADFTEQMYDTLESLAIENNVELTSVAVAAYLACHLNDSPTSETNSGFAWVLIDALLSVFARSNQKYTLYRLPHKEENIDCVSVKDNMLLVNNKPVTRDGVPMMIDAPDCNRVVIEVINERPYAFVKKNCKGATECEEIKINKNETIEFGMMGYAQLWKGLTDEQATDAKKCRNALINATNKAIKRGEFCIVATPEYKMAVAIYDDEQKCYRLAGHIIAFDKSLPVNIMWKKFKLTNYFNDWKHNKNGSYKSVRGMTAQCIDIADEEAIALIGEDNKTFKLQPVYVD